MIFSMTFWRAVRSVVLVIAVGSVAWSNPVSASGIFLSTCTMNVTLPPKVVTDDGADYEVEFCSIGPGRIDGPLYAIVTWRTQKQGLRRITVDQDKPVVLGCRRGKYPQVFTLTWKPYVHAATELTNTLERCGDNVYGTVTARIYSK